MSVGTHQGHISDPEQRKRMRAKADRNRSRRPGVTMPNQTTARKPCHSYEECHHRKHGWTAGKAKGNNGKKWPIPFETSSRR